MDRAEDPKIVEKVKDEILECQIEEQEEVASINSSSKCIIFGEVGHPAKKCTKPSKQRRERSPPRRNTRERSPIRRHIIGNQEGIEVRPGEVPALKENARIAE